VESTVVSSVEFFDPPLPLVADVANGFADASGCMLNSPG
jgi:hypothetical protein